MVNNSKINTKELITKISKKMNCYEKDAKEIIAEHLFDVITEELKKGNIVGLHPFGKFYLKDANKPLADGSKRRIVKFKASSNFQKIIDNHFLGEDAENT